MGYSKRIRKEFVEISCKPWLWLRVDSCTRTCCIFLLKLRKENISIRSRIFLSDRTTGWFIVSLSFILRRQEIILAEMSKRLSILADR